MATAHGVMTIEIELGDLERSLEVARTLVEPLAAELRGGARLRLRPRSGHGRAHAGEAGAVDGARRLRGDCLRLTERLRTAIASSVP